VETNAEVNEKKKDTSTDVSINKQSFGSSIFNFGQILFTLKFMTLYVPYQWPDLHGMQLLHSQL
jgi:hypothetical protein